MTMNVVALM